jgi:hypothetical protein
MWAIRHPTDGIMAETFSDTQAEAYLALFDHMPDEFQSKYWKQPARSRRAYTKLGYRAVKVELVEIPS